MTDLDIVITALKEEAAAWDAEAGKSADDGNYLPAAIFKATAAAMKNVATRISNDQKTRQTAAGTWQNVRDL